MEKIVLNKFEQKLQSTSLTDMDLFVRSFNALSRYFHVNKMDLNAASIAKLQGRLNEVRNIGRRCIDEISEIMMKQFGIETNP